MPRAANANSPVIFLGSCTRTLSSRCLSLSRKILGRQTLNSSVLELSENTGFLGLLYIEQGSVCHTLISPSPLVSAVFLIGSCLEWSVALLTRRGDRPVSPSGWNLDAGGAWQQPHLHRGWKASESSLIKRTATPKHQKSWQPTSDPQVTFFNLVPHVNSSTW